jgi:uncharacterized protein DUF3300
MQTVRREQFAGPNLIRRREVRLVLEGVPREGLRMKRSVLVAVCLCLGCVASGGQAQQPPPAQQTQQTQQTPADIDSLVAPIALYPDQLLAQILMCAGDPESVRNLDAFLKANPKLKGSELQDAALLKGFEPSFVALVLFPDVVQRMAAKLDWTKLVGQVFVADRGIVFASIQKLRAQAHNVGNLKSNEQQQVETQTTSTGQEVIVIEPTNPQVVYVPQYNPTVVYTQAPATTVVVQQSSSADAVAAGMIGFTAGIVIGAAVNNNYYYGPYGWHGGGAYMYNDAWEDAYDRREDARDDWQDHREDLSEERGDRRENTQEQRTERTESRNENRPESQARRDQAKSTAQTNRANGQTAGTQSRATGTTAGTQSRASGTTASTQSRGSGAAEARGTTSSTSRTPTDRSGTKSDAFSGYSSGRSERAASSRGTQSRSSSRGGGGGGRRR